MPLPLQTPSVSPPTTATSVATSVPSAVEANSDSVDAMAPPEVDLLRRAAMASRLMNDPSLGPDVQSEMVSASGQLQALAAIRVGEGGQARVRWKPAMSLADRRVVLFDYGNTLVPFHAPQIEAVDDALAAALRDRYGPFDRAQLSRIRHADRMAPYSGDPPAWRENDLFEVTAHAVRALFDRDATADDLEALVQVRRDAFVAGVSAGEGVAALLAHLGGRHRLGLVSNYPCGTSIRRSLDRTGLAAFFDVVVVSGDLGRVKPHPAPFEAALASLGEPADAAVYVGDNWLADVQGAKRAGLAAVWLRQYAPAERFDPAPGDAQPDATIDHLDALRDLF